MALAATLGRAGFAPERIATVAKVHLLKNDTGFVIPTIELETEAAIPNIDDAKFQELAKTAKETCPVSKALAGVEIKLSAKLVSA